MRFSEFLTEAVSSLKMAVDMHIAIPVDSQFHVGSKDKSFRESAELVADSLSKAVNMPVNHRSKMGSRGRAWHIQPATNANTVGAHHIQVVSPLMPAGLAKHALKAVVKWIDDNDLETQDSDNLSVSFRIPALNEKLDPVKFLMFLTNVNAKDILSGSVPNTSVAELQIMLNKVKNTGKLPLQAKSLHSAAIKYLSDRADGTANFGHATDDIIEFKVLSGSGYHHHINDALKTVTRLQHALETATSASALKSEYISKLKDLFSNTEPLTATMIKLPKQLESLADYDGEIGRIWKLYKHDSDLGEAKEALLVLIDRIMAAAKKRKRPLTHEERSYIEKLISDTKLSAEDLDKHFRFDRHLRLKVKVAFAI